MTAMVGETRRVAECGEAERRACFELLDRLFLGVAWEDFVRDFEEKDAVILLRDAQTGALGGFSTVTELEVALPGDSVPVVFSGDTAVLPEYRTSFAVGRELVRYFLRAYERRGGEPPSYVLSSKGWRTYKILPFFFREFFPRYDVQTPPSVRALIDAFGEGRYPGRYRDGVIRGDEASPRLRPGGVDALPHRLDPHTEYFLEANSGFLRGDELVCTARIEPANFTRQLTRLA